MSTKPPSTIDPNNSRLVLRDDLVFAPRRSSGKTVVHIECRTESKFFRIGYSEYLFMSLLDGQRTLAQALALAAQAQGADAITTDEATELYLWLVRNKLGTIAGSSKGAIATEDSKTSGKTDRKYNPFWMKFPFGSPKLLIEKLTNVFGWAFSFPAFVLGLLFIGFAITFGTSNWSHIKNYSEGVFAPENWLWMFLTWVFLKVVHESAHAISAKRYGAEVDDCGVVMVLFAPMAYVDITSAWRLPSKWHRIHIAIAGIYAELIIASGATFAMLNCESIVLGQALFNLLVMAGLSTVLFNANPLMRFDGYFVLSDLIEIPNLYQEGSTAFKKQIRRLFFGPWFKQHGTNPRMEASRSRELFVAAYGWLTAGWRIFICLSLAITASVLWKGAGIVLAVFGVLMWFGPILLNLYREISRRWRNNRLSIFRPVVTGVVIVVLFSTILKYSPPPCAVSVPGVVEYSDVAHVRSISSAFIERIHVQDGQTVQAGDLLLVLRNEEVSRKYDDLKLQIQQSQIQRSMAIEERNIAKAQIELSNLRSLQNRLNEAKRLAEGLTIRAPNSGKIICRNLKHQVGNFVSEGSTLLSIGCEDQKELVILLADHDLDRVASRIGANVQVVGGLFCRHQGQFIRLQPRASKTLPFESLAATQGGPLAVVQTKKATGGDSSLELVKPRFHGVISLKSTDSRRFFSGQRVSVQITNGADTLGSWFTSSIECWIDQKILEAS